MFAPDEDLYFTHQKWVHSAGNTL